ncbi:MAG: hypothetical protein WD873_07400 [Candidatus Hydrogenedentales bacterium]
MKLHIWMLLGCLVPFLLIFVLPIFGVSEGALVPIFVLAMLGCHLLMMRGHNTKHSDH